MVTQEHPMSDAKRDHSAFRCTAAASQAATPRAYAAVPPQTLKIQTLKLEVLEVAPPWGSLAVVGGDPYNAVGPRARLCPRALQKRAM
jgi:hypothetical protein